MTNRNQNNSTAYVHPQESNLFNVHTAMQYNNDGQPVLRTHVDGISLAGDVIVDKVKLWDGTNNLVFDLPSNDAETAPWSLPTESHNMVFNGSTWDRMRGNIADGVLTQISNDYLAISKDTNANAEGNPIYVNVTNGISTVSLSQSTLDALETVTVNQGTAGSTAWKVDIGTNGTVTVNQPVAVTQHAYSTPWQISKNSTVNSASNPINVSAAITGIATVDFPPSATTAFGELISIPMTPVIQADVIHGLDPDMFSKSEVNGGTVVISENSVWQVNSGTSANGYARLKTNRFLRYQPGQGAIGRWTAAFTCTGTTKLATGVDNIYQLAGFYGREDGYAFGFSGDPANPTIGVLHRYGGKVEIRTLLITTAPTGNQTITITLNGVPYSVAVVAGSTGETAGRIATELKLLTDADNRWDIQYCANTVTFCYYTSGEKNGTYSLSSTGAGTLAAGTFSRSQIGAAPTDVWTYVQDWNGTPVNFDPSKLNLFSVDFRWLGAGRVRFMMEDPATGEIVTVHTQLWGSSSLIPHMIKPNLRISYRSGSTSGATAPYNVVVSGASCMAGVEGIINQTGHSEGWYDINSTNRPKDLVHHLLSIQNPYIRTNGLNTSQLIIQDLTVAAQGADPSVIYVIVNPLGVSSPLVFAPIPGPATTRVFAQASNSAVTETLSMDNVSNVQTLAINGSATFDLKPYNFSLAPGDMISVFISSSNAITRSSIGLSWRVD